MVTGLVGPGKLPIRRPVCETSEADPEVTDKLPLKGVMCRIFSYHLPCVLSEHSQCCFLLPYAIYSLPLHSLPLWFLKHTGDGKTK